MCRKFPLVYTEDVKLFEEEIPAWRYVAPLDVFDDTTKNPENECYCTRFSNLDCAPSGVFDASKCNFDAPIFVSFPHFLGGDPKLFELFEGLNPIAELHRTYADVHPRLAFPIYGASRFQVNVRLNKKMEMPITGIECQNMFIKTQ